MEDSGRFIARIPTCRGLGLWRIQEGSQPEYLGGQGYGGFRKVSSQNTLGVRVMEDSGTFLARIPRGLGLWRIQESSQPEYLGGQGYGGFRKVPSQNTQGVRIMEDSGRFLVRIPRGLWLWRIQEGSQPEYLGDQGYGGFRKVPSQNTQGVGVRVMEDSGRFIARIPTCRGLGLWRIQEGSQPEYLGGQGYGGFRKVPSQNTQGVRIMEDSGRFLVRIPRGLWLWRIQEGSQPEYLGDQGYGGFRKVPSQNTQGVGVRVMEDSGRFIARIPTCRGLGLWRIQEGFQPEYLGGQGYGGFRKVPSQNTLGVRVMEDSGKFLARIPRGLGLWRIQEGSQPEYLGGQDYGGFRKVSSQNTQGVMVMEDSGRFLARIPRGLGLWRIQEGSQPEYLGGGGQGYGGFRKVHSQNTYMQGVRVMEDSGTFLARIPRGLGLWRIQEGSQPEYLGGQGYGGFGKVPSQNTQGVRVMEDSGRFLARIPWGLGLWRIQESSQPEYLWGQGYGGFRKVPSQNTQGVRIMEDSGRFLVRIPRGLWLWRIQEGSQPEYLGGQGYGGFRKVPSQNTQGVGVRVMEDSGRFIARIPTCRGLGLWRIQERFQPEYLGGQGYGGFRKVPSQNTLGVRVMEDSGRFLARIPRGLGLWRIQEGSQPEYLGGQGYGGFGKVPSQNTQGVRVMEDSGIKVPNQSAWVLGQSAQLGGQGFKDKIVNSENTFTLLVFSVRHWGYLLTDIAAS